MKKDGKIFVILAAVLWGCLPVFVRYFRDFSSMEIVFLRGFYSVILLLIYALFKDRSVLKIRLKDLWCFLGTGIVAVLFFNFCYYESIKSVSMAVAAILLYTAPAFVMVLSALLFKEKITGRKVTALIMSFIGCALVSGILSGEQSIGFKGLMIGLGSGLGYALYSIFSRFALNRGYSSVTITFYTFLFSTIGVIPFLGKKFSGRFMEGKTVLIAFLFAFFTNVLAYIFYTAGLERLENSRASIIACIEPVTASILGFIFFSEVPDIFSVIGIILVLSSTVIVNLKGKEQ
ncbi:MAG: DMT family transporter [Clostridia bacterium]|nr:DMT family transporter [Clostridia bacterium]